MINSTLKKIYILLFILVVLIPFISFAQEKDNINTQEVSVEKVNNSILNKIPDTLSKPFLYIIKLVENERKNLNIYAEKEIAAIKNLSYQKNSENTTSPDSAFTNPSLGDSQAVFNQVKYYLFSILAFITSQQILFWALIFLLFFSVLRTVIRIIF